MDGDPTEAPEETPDQPATPDDAPDTGSATEDDKTGGPLDADFDLSQVPEDADRDWLAGRFNDFRADYTRKTQALADQRKQIAEEQEQIEQAKQAQAILAAAQDPSHPSHKQAIEYLGLEIDDDEDEFGGETPNELEQRLAAIEAAERQRQETAQETQQREQMEAYLTSEFEDAQRREGREFDENELRLIYSDAFTNPDQNGRPDVAGAVDRLKAYLATQQKGWISSKQTPRAPGSGVSATRDVDYNDRDALLAEQTRVAEAAMQSD